MTHLPVLAGTDPGEDFRSVVDAIAKDLPLPVDPRISVLLDDLPDSSARLDLVRLAVIVVLEREAPRFQVLPVTACHWNRIGSEWLISREHPSRGFTFADGKEQSPWRTVTLTEEDGIVHVTSGDVRIAVAVPSEEDCRRLLKTGVRGTPLRFPVFPSAGASILARGDGPDELLLWRCGLPVTRYRMAGPVLAATHVADTSQEQLIALVEVDGELVRVEHGQDPGTSELRTPIGFSVTDEAERDLSPLYLDMDEPWRYGVYFRRAGRWWNLRYHGGTVTLAESRATTHQPGRRPWHAEVFGGDRSLFGPNGSHGELQGSGWKIWNTDGAVIPDPPDEHVLGLTEVEGQPALLTREGEVVRARRQHDVRTVVEFEGPVIRHHGLPWVAVQRSAHLVEVVDVATGAVLHRVDTA